MKRGKVFFVVLLTFTMCTGFISMSTQVKAVITPTVCENLPAVQEMQENDTLIQHFPDIAFATYVAEVILKQTGVDVQTYQLTNTDMQAIYGTQSLVINSSYPVQQLDGIHHFKALRILSVDQKDVTSQKLQTLPMEMAYVKDTLVSLTIGYAGLQEVPSVISCLENVTTLNFQYNQIRTGAQRVINLENLSNLSFLGNYIQDVPVGISNLTKLTHLSFAFNRIKEIPQEVYTLPNLQILAFATNQITSIEGAQHMASKNLIQFTLAYNQIIDFSPLYALATSGQFGNQYRMIDTPEIVDEGATTVEIDLKDYAFNHMGARVPDNEAYVLYFPQLVTTIGFYDESQSYYSHYNNPITPSDRTKAVVVDRNSEQTKVTLDIQETKQFGKHVIIRFEAVGEKLDDQFNWSSFGVNNNDLTYIIPIEEYIPPRTGYTVYYWEDAIGSDENHANYIGRHDADAIHLHDDEITLSDELIHKYIDHDPLFVVDSVSKKNLRINIEQGEENIFHVVYKRNEPVIKKVGYVIYYWENEIGSDLSHENYLGTYTSEAVYVDGDKVELTNDLIRRFIDKDPLYTLKSVSKESLIMDATTSENNVFHVVYAKQAPAIAPKIEQPPVALPSVATYDTTKDWLYIFFVGIVAASILIINQRKYKKPNS